MNNTFKNFIDNITNLIMTRGELGYKDFLEHIRKSSIGNHSLSTIFYERERNIPTNSIDIYAHFRNLSDFWTKTENMTFIYTINSILNNF